MIIVLDNIRSTHNVGAIFRTAEGVGVDEIILVGITPSPIDRFGRKRSDLAKSAVGAQELVAWKYFGTTSEAIGYVQSQADTIIALEQTPQSVDYKTISPVDNSSRVAFVVGNEIDGVSNDWLSLASHICHIPMQGQKESLNVATACGIALFRLLDC
ncbi:MAG: TrmH family RNA methyltransferase [Patescibacteria group bacterium]